MVVENSSAHRQTLKILLEDLARKTGLGVVFTHRDENLDESYRFISRANFCGFCSTMAEDDTLAKFCNLDHQYRGLSSSFAGKLQTCHAGLFNISFPIRIGREIVASILVGQRKIVGKEMDSQEKFQNFVQKLPLSEKKKVIIENLFREVEAVRKEKIEQESKLFANPTHRIIEHLLLEEQYTRARITGTVHELLLPMQSIVIEAENLREESYEEQMNKDFLREAGSRILCEIGKLSLHANNLRKVMELPIITSKYEFRVLPVFPLIEQARQSFNLQAKEKQVTIKRPSYTGRIFPRLRLVKDEIQVALNNLYSNAVKYSYAGQISRDRERYIETECFDETIEGKKYFSVEISNFGVGILQQEIESGEIFMAGYRGKLSRDRYRTGSGLGLYLIREIVVGIHTGKIEVRSEEKEFGYVTSIKVMLPYS